MEEFKNMQLLLAAAQEREHELNARIADLSDFIEQGAMPLHWVDRNGMIIWANQAELDMVGFTRTEYIGQPIARFHADQEIIADILKRLSADETIANYPAKLVCKNGEIKEVLINSNVKRENGEFIHTRCFTRDISAAVAEEKRLVGVLIDLEQSEARLLMAMESTDSEPGIMTCKAEHSPGRTNAKGSMGCRLVNKLILILSLNIFTLMIQYLYSVQSIGLWNPKAMAVMISSSGSTVLTMEVHAG